jgi:hypothetical protein
MAIDGALGMALVDFESKVCLGAKGDGTLDMELAGAAITEDIQAFDQHSNIFSYLVLDKKSSSLPLARTHLRSIGRELVLDTRPEENGEGVSGGRF